MCQAFSLLQIVQDVSTSMSSMQMNFFSFGYGHTCPWSKPNTLFPMVTPVSNTCSISKKRNQNWSNDSVINNLFDRNGAECTATGEKGIPLNRITV